MARWRVGPRPVETSQAFQVVPTAVSLALAFVLLVWYGALQRQVRVTMNLDRLEVILDGGAPPAGRSVAEGACVEVQRVEVEVSPLLVVMGASAGAGRPVVAPAVGWVERATGVPLMPWVDIGAVREAARGLCDGTRHAARARLPGADPAAARADVEASRRAFARAITAVGTIDPLVQQPASVTRVPGLARVGSRLVKFRQVIDAHALDAPALTALALASGPVVEGEGRGATYAIIARAHPDGGGADAMAIARVTVRDGAIIGHRVDTAAGWQGGRPSGLQAPAALARATGSLDWRLADFDWWLDFRRGSAQFLALWSVAGHDAAGIDAIIAIDEAILDRLGAPPVTGSKDDAAVAGRLEAVLQARTGDRLGAATLVAALASSGEVGMAVAWFREAAVQAVVEARGWAGLAAPAPAGEVSTLRRAARGARAHVREVIDAGVVPEGVRLGHAPGGAPDGTMRVVIDAAVGVRAVTGAGGTVEVAREGALATYDIPVGPGGMPTVLLVR